MYQYFSLICLAEFTKRLKIASPGSIYSCCHHKSFQSLVNSQYISQVSVLFAWFFQNVYNTVEWSGATFNSAGNTNNIKDSCKILICLETVLICLSSPKCLKYQNLADSQYTRLSLIFAWIPPKYIQYNQPGNIYSCWQHNCLVTLVNSPYTSISVLLVGISQNVYNRFVWSHELYERVL